MVKKFHRLQGCQMFLKCLMFLKIESFSIIPFQVLFVATDLFRIYKRVCRRQMYFLCNLHCKESQKVDQTLCVQVARLCLNLTDNRWTMKTSPNYIWALTGVQVSCTSLIDGKEGPWLYMMSGQHSQDYWMPSTPIYLLIFQYSKGQISSKIF